MIWAELLMLSLLLRIAQTLDSKFWNSTRNGRNRDWLSRCYLVLCLFVCSSLHHNGDVWDVRVYRGLCCNLHDHYVHLWCFGASGHDVGVDREDVNTEMLVGVVHLHAVVGGGHDPGVRPMMSADTKSYCCLKCVKAASSACVVMFSSKYGKPTEIDRWRNKFEHSIACHKLIMGCE